MSLVGYNDVDGDGFLYINVGDDVRVMGMTIWVCLQMMLMMIK